MTEVPPPAAPPAPPGRGDRWLVPALAGVFGAVLITAVLGPALVHPTNLEWLMQGDFSLHFFGWHLYRAGPWTLPVGATPLLIWPVGSSVGLTDSIPIAAIFFKLFDPWLPAEFQFIGLWLVLCFALQGVFGAVLMQLATPRPALQLAGALLFVLCPPLIFRFHHAALAAHWLLLAALWLSLRADADEPTARRAAHWALLCMAAAAIQPYILFMVLVMMLAAFLRVWLQAPRRWPAIGLHAAIALAATWVALWQSGSLMVASDDGLAVGGFGVFSANLLTFVMPAEAATLLWPGPIRYANWLQYEGYAYLGLGTALLGLCVLAAGVRRIRPAAIGSFVRRHAPLLLALLFLWLMALGPEITAGPRTLLKYDGWWWTPFTIFRTSGRMIWPVYYALVAAILFAASRFRHRTALALVGAAVIVQAIDLWGMTRHVANIRVFGFRDPLVSRFWTVAPPHYQRLVLHPTNLCARAGALDHQPFSLLAARHRLPINAGATARYDRRGAAAYCESLKAEIAGGMRTPGTLYIVRKDLLAGLTPAAAGAGVVCGEVDGFGVCVSKDSHRAWLAGFTLLPAGASAPPAAADRPPAARR